MDRGRLLTRDELPMALAEFGIEYKDRMVRELLKAVDVKAKEIRGRQYLYDPVSVWVLAFVAFRSKRSFGGLERELDVYRDLAVEAQSVEYAEYIPTFFEDAEFAAQLLLITGPDFGMPPRDLLDLVGSKPCLLEYCLNGKDFMYNALDSYKTAYGLWLTSEPLIREFWHEPISDEGLRRSFASRFVESLAAKYAPCPDLDGYEDSLSHDDQGGIS